MASRKTPQPVWLRYAIALAVVAFAAGVRATLLHRLGTRAPYLTFFPAVILAALYGGLWPGLMAAALSAILAAFFWIEPVGHLMIADPMDWTALIVFLASSSLICGVAEAMHRARARAADSEADAKLAAERARAEDALRAANQDLERRVGERTAELAA